MATFNPTYNLGEDVVWRISRYLNGRILAILNLYVAPMPPITFWLNLTWFGRRCCLYNFKMATVAASDQLGYQNGMILAILNLCVTVMPPIKFWLNPTYGLGDVVWRISIWPPWQPSWILERMGGDDVFKRWPSWISERNNFSNSESLYHCHASHQVSAQSDLWFGRCCLKNFDMAAMATILDIGKEWF